VTLIALAHQSAGHDVWATVIVVVSLLAMPVFSVWFLWRHDDGPDDSDGGGGGGPGGGGPPPDPPTPPDGPAWWPEFEREFADYVANVVAPSR
jgi:hypothetical protein